MRVDTCKCASQRSFLAALDTNILQETFSQKSKTYVQELYLLASTKRKREKIIQCCRKFTYLKLRSNLLYLLQLFVTSDLFIICLSYILQSPQLVPRPCDAHKPSEPSFFQLRNLGLSQRWGPECRRNYRHLIAEAIHKEEAANSLRCFWGRKVSGRERVDDGREGDEHFVVSFVIVVIMKVDSLWKHRHTWKNVIHSWRCSQT